MNLGIDLRILQIGHQYRGIGSHVMHLLDGFARINKDIHFVFYIYPNMESPEKLIKKPLLDMKYYEFRYAKPRASYTKHGTFFNLRDEIKNDFITGDAGLGSLDDIDLFLAIDFNLGVPRAKKVKTLLITYDLIPWVLSEQYLPGFGTSRSAGLGFKSSMKAAFDKRTYFRKIHRANKRANHIIAISEHTKHDIVKYLDMPAAKISTVLLGVDKNQSITNSESQTVSFRHIDGSKEKFNTTNITYVFFMGGADRRRRIEDIVEAFNTVRTRNKNLKLILAGYDFKNFEEIPDTITRDSIKTSAYHADILLAGFVTNSEKVALYKDAVAYVFPSMYEGFGLPLLEAMNLSCPIITYNNSSIKEVGGRAVLYAKNALEISDQITKLIEQPGLRKKLITSGRFQVKKFDWQRTSEHTIDIIKKLVQEK